MRMFSSTPSGLGSVILARRSLDLGPEQNCGMPYLRSGADSLSLVTDTVGCTYILIVLNGIDLNQLDTDGDG